MIRDYTARPVGWRERLAITGLDGRRLLAQENIEILASLPNMAFPFFVHMMSAIKSEADKLGGITIVEQATARVPRRSRRPMWRRRS
jgi:hypothetical protein